MRWYLLRHAQSENNVKPESGPVLSKKRKCDPEITELGKKQSTHAAYWLLSHVQNNPQLNRFFKITKIYCSPMLRSVQTAKILQSILNVPVEICVFLHEQGGIFEGLRCDATDLSAGNYQSLFKGANVEMLKKELPTAIFPEELLKKSAHEGWWSGARESWQSSITRVQHIAKWMWDFELEATEEKAAALIVGHGMVHDMLMKVLLGIKLPSCKIDDYQVADMPNYFLSGNCCLTILQFASNKSKYLSKQETFQSTTCPITEGDAEPLNNDQFNHNSCVAVISWNQIIIPPDLLTGQAMGTCPRVSIC